MEFDPSKSRRNEILRGISFELVREFDFITALTKIDARCDYGETRYTSIGPIAYRLHVLVFTMRPPGIRVISLRKANDREVALYEQET
ncbi:BrnT family toxin [Burkholderia sp. L27(2015)]|uniref:BrnT family toxin n=1 Tax=Burkholderia sp. L27(2015) TaxID=1641858 RepID=UPI00131BA848|nr:BrnT family toxin [Burkholderia sp. L27(2015)]